MINVEGKKGNGRNKCRLSSRYGRAGCYHQIINSPKWCWGHFNKPIQGGLLLLGIMITGNTVFYMNNGGYILQPQSLLELFHVCWYIWHFSLIIAKWVVWYLYFHRYKKIQNQPMKLSEFCKLVLQKRMTSIQSQKIFGMWQNLQS